MFSRIIEASSNLEKHTHILKISQLDTKRGPMIAMGDKDALYLLEFAGRRGLERGIERLKHKTKSVIIPGVTEPIHSIEAELNQYFEGKLQTFKTPFLSFGSPFQEHVWEELRKIPYGQTCSYADIAARIGNPSAYRAVANANGANQIAILIPCHRVINKNGALGGYGGGVEHKAQLLNLEQRGWGRVPTP